VEKVIECAHKASDGSDHVSIGILATILTFLLKSKIFSQMPTFMIASQ
jgi:hypothetical protein